MNQHVIDKIYFDMCQLENAGDMVNAVIHLRIMWNEIQSSGVVK